MIRKGKSAAPAQKEAVAITDAPREDHSCLLRNYTINKTAIASSNPMMFFQGWIIRMLRRRTGGDVTTKLPLNESINGGN